MIQSQHPNRAPHHKDECCKLNPTTTPTAIGTRLEVSMESIRSKMGQLNASRFIETSIQSHAQKQATSTQWSMT